MSQTKLTFKEGACVWFKGLLIVMALTFISGMLGALSALTSSIVIPIIFYTIMFVFFLGVHYMIFFKFSQSNGASADVICPKRKNIASFILTTICGGISSGIMTIIAVLSTAYPVKFITDLVEDKWDLEFDDENGLGLVVVAWLISVLMSCVVAKWFAYRTQNAGIKWAAILPILLADVYLGLVIIFVVGEFLLAT